MPGAAQLGEHRRLPPPPRMATFMPLFFANEGKGLHYSRRTIGSHRLDYSPHPVDDVFALDVPSEEAAARYNEPRARVVLDDRAQILGGGVRGALSACKPASSSFVGSVVVGHRSCPACVFM